jgi:hypothetical protein
MGIKETLTCCLMNRLPAEEQAELVADLIAWRFADLSPTVQGQRIEQFGPGLMHTMREGRVGLPLLVLHHLLRLPPSHWLARRATTAPRVCGEMAAAEDP